MNNVKSVEVNINNKYYTICAVESEEYIKKIASYINKKYDDFKNLQGYDKMNVDMKTILMEINLADDYFKKDQDYVKCYNSNEKNKKEIKVLTEELISCQAQNDELEEDLEQLKEDFAKAQEEIDDLKDELARLKEKNKL